MATVVIPGLPHHITRRGVRRRDVFFGDEDRLRCLEFVREAAQRFGVAIWSWCVMTSHVHFVAVPQGEKSLALCFGEAHTQYMRMVDFRHGWRGHQWQGRCRASVVARPRLAAPWATPRSCGSSRRSSTVS